MAGLGDSILVAKSEQTTPHLWIVITSPCPKTNDVIMVNITDRQGHSDTTTILESGVHPFVKKVSVIYYADAMIVKAAKIDAVVKEGSGKPHAPCGGPMLKRIQQGVLASPHARPRIKEAFKQAQAEGRDKTPPAGPAPQPAKAL